MPPRPLTSPAATATLIAVVASSLLAGCSEREAAGPTDPIDVELADFAFEQLVANPFGAGRVVGGRLVIDFSDELELAAIDAQLEAEGLRRIGLIGGYNVVTAEIVDGRDELVAQAAIEQRPGVDLATLAFEALPHAVATNLPPIRQSAPGSASEVLSDLELFINWPHYMMDTHPAHALADAVLGTGEPGDVIVAILDTGSFHDQRATVGSTASERSLLSDASGDTDLGPRLVQPTGIRVDGATGVGTITVGRRDVADNALIHAGSSLHGLEVASAAVASGQHVRGTGRHAKFRPFLLSRSFVQGVCTNDRSITCSEGDAGACPEGAGVCDTGIGTVDYLLGALATLARNLSPAEAEQVRVVNISLGFEVEDPGQRDRLRRLFAAPLADLLRGERLLVVSAGNEGASTEDRMFPLLGAERGTARTASNDPVAQKLIVVSGTALPLGNTLALLFDPVDTTSLDFAGQSERAYSDTNHGPRVHVAAPAEHVPVLDRDLERRRVVAGTSFSSPYVAGLAAEMFALDPGASAVEIATLIERTSDDLGPSGPDDRFGHGRVNVWKALLAVLNRRRAADDPAWIGVRIRYALEVTPDALLFVGDRPAGDPHWRRVPASRSDDNSGELPSPDVLPAALTSELSLGEASFDGPGGIALLEVCASASAPIYQLPVRRRDLLDQRVLGSRIDDFVVDVDVAVRASSVYGRVTDEAGRAVADAVVAYTTHLGIEGEVRSDADGYYTLYDAIADTRFEIRANKSGATGDAYDLTVPALLAARQDFVLGEGGSGGDFPRLYRGVATTTQGLVITWDGGGAIECQGSGEWTATLDERGEVLLLGATDRTPSWDSSGAICTGTGDAMVIRGPYQASGSFSFEFPYEGTTATISGSFDEDRFRGSYAVTSEGTVAGWGAVTQSESVLLELARQ